jgi:hypothetical protein
MTCERLQIFHLCYRSAETQDIRRAHSSRGASPSLLFNPSLSYAFASLQCHPRKSFSFWKILLGFTFAPLRLCVRFSCLWLWLRRAASLREIFGLLWLRLRGSAAFGVKDNRVTSSAAKLRHRRLYRLTGQIGHDIGNHELLHRFMGIDRATTNVGSQHHIGQSLEGIRY